MAKILIVEDEPAMLAGLSDNLEFEGHLVDAAENGKIGLEKIMNESHDLVLLDVMLPEISGFDILKKARRSGIQTPIILLTARGEEMDKVRGLELGADDYITKPFSLRELLARVKANLRRSSTVTVEKQNENEIQIGRLKINFNKLEASENGASVKLSHKEFDILKYMHRRANQIITRDELLNQVWGDEYAPTDIEYGQKDH